MAGISSSSARFLALNKLLLLLLMYQNFPVPNPVTASPSPLATGATSSQSVHRKRPVNVAPLLLGKETKAPWNAALFNSQTKDYICSGSLIKSSVVLTAAHCIVENVDEYLVLLGATSGHYEEAVTSSSVQAARVPRSKIYTHAAYSGSPNYHNDIALLILDTPIVLNDRVQVIKLPTQVQTDLVDSTSVNLQVAGLGLTSEDRVSHTLNGINVITFDCTRLESIIEFDEKTTICAGPTNFKQGVCSGDSGGGMTLSEKDPEFEEYVENFIIGITSQGLHDVKNVKGCHKNGVFTKVAPFIGWIDKILAKALPSSQPLTSPDFVSIMEFKKIQAELQALQEEMTGHRRNFERELDNLRAVTERLRATLGQRMDKIERENALGTRTSGDKGEPSVGVSQRIFDTNELSEIKASVQETRKIAGSFAMIGQARMYAGENFTGATEDYNTSPVVYGASCYNLQWLARKVKSIDTRGSCVRLFPSADCKDGDRSFAILSSPTVSLLPAMKDPEWPINWQDARNLSMTWEILSISSCLQPAVALKTPPLANTKSPQDSSLRAGTTSTPVAKTTSNVEYLKVMNAITRVPRARFYAGLNKTDAFEDYNLRDVYSVGCKNLTWLAGKVQSIEPYDRCLRIFTGLDCSGTMYSVYSESRYTNNLWKNMVGRVYSAGPCFHTPNNARVHYQTNFDALEETYIWRIYGAAAKRSSKSTIWSEAFYSNPGGYKFRVKVYFDGDGSYPESAGKSLSIFMSLLPGEFDGGLVWPCNKSVTVTLFDQPNQGAAAMDVKKSLNLASYPGYFDKAIAGNGTGPGYGWATFISHEQLWSKDYHYVRPDDLYIGFKFY